MNNDQIKGVGVADTHKGKLTAQLVGSGQTQKVMRTFVKDGEMLFVVKDVCAALEIRKYRDALNRLDDDERMSMKADTLGGQQEMTYVNESGLYHLIFMSRRPIAVAFRRWITMEVVPAIHRTGFYADPDSIMRAREYLSARKIAANPQGFAYSCMAVCRRLGIKPERRRGDKSYGFPVRVLDEAAASSGKAAGKPPLALHNVTASFVFPNSLTA